MKSRSPGRGVERKPPSSRSARTIGTTHLRPVGDPRWWGVPALIVGVCLTGVVSFTPALDNDVWWHLATGRWILSGAGIPKSDPFTYTALGRPWVTHEWMSEVLFYSLYRIKGIDLLVVLKSVLAAFAIALSALAAMVGARSRERLAGAAVGALLAAPLIAARAFVRPHMLTALFLGGLLLLLRLESESGRRLWRMLLAPLFLLWANLHSGFVLGFALLGLYWTGEALAVRLAGTRGSARPVWRERGLVMLLCFAASLVNPHHIHAHLYPFHLIAREEVRGGIVELRNVFHPTYRGAWFLWGLAATGLAGLVLLVDSRRRLVWPLLLPGILFAVLGLASLRGLSEFSVLVPAVLGAHAAALGRRPHVASGVSIGVIVLGLTGGIVAFVRGMPVGEGSAQRIGLAAEPGSRPVAAARFLREERPAGSIFNLLSYGGYLINELGPQTKVYIDGRLDIFPPGFLKSYTRMLETGEGWKDTVDRYGITMAVVNHVPDPERDQGLRARLRSDPDWACVLAGDYTLVYARRVPENAAILSRYAIGFDPSARYEDFIGAFASRASPAEISQAITALENMHRIAPDEIAPSLFAGQILDRVGRSSDALPFARRAAMLDPESRPLRQFLAETLQRADSLDAARHELARILAENPEDAQALSTLAMVERSEGRLQDAVRLLEKAAALSPADVMVHVRLGVILAEAGRIAEGRRHLLRALALRPGDPVATRNLQALEALDARQQGIERP